MKKTIKYIWVICALCIAMISCDKVSPTGLLIAGSGVNERVKMSMNYFKNKYEEKCDYHLENSASSEYSILIGSDSHVWDDSTRMHECFEIAFNSGDLFVAHLGDLADTQAEPYNITYRTVAYWDSLGVYFFPVVGNHDVTHNGWAYFTTIFQSSCYIVNVYVGKDGTRDVHIFMDTASGTLGDIQLDWLESQIREDGMGKIRNIYTYGHTNMFRGKSGNLEFASTFAREELYKMLKWNHDWNTYNTTAHNMKVFCGHIHEYGHWTYGGVDYYNAESMSERNNPEPGYYLLRLNCHEDGTSDVVRVWMETSPQIRYYNPDEDD